MSTDHATKEIKDLMIGLSLIEKRTIQKVSKAEELYEQIQLETAYRIRSLTEGILNCHRKFEQLLSIVEKQDKKIESLEEQIKQLRKTTKEK